MKVRPGLLIPAILLSSLILLLSCSDEDNPVNGGDTARPTVIATVPVDGTEFVLLPSNISATFSEDMDPASLNSSSFFLDPATSGAISYSGREVTFNPTALLDSNTNYTATITTAAKDLAGNGLAANYTWQFSTFRDTVAPTITETSPPDGFQFHKINRSISATFSENMDPSTMIAGTFVIAPIVAGSVSYASRVFTFTPSTLLVDSTTYTATITTAARDLTGNALAQDFIWQFATFPDTMPPSSSVFTPVNGAVFGDSVAIEVIAADPDGIGVVQFFADGSLIAGSDDSIPPYEYVWYPTGDTLGSTHELSALVFDSVGNYAMSDTVTVHYLWRLLISDIDEPLIHRDLKNVYARSSQTLLEFRVETNEGWVDYRSPDSLGIDVAFYLDTDRSRATGDTETVVNDVPVPINDIGAEYLIVIGYHGDDLSAWIDDSWADRGLVDSLRITGNSDFFEVAIRHSRIASPLVFDLVVASHTLFKTSPSDPGIYKLDWAPDQGQGHVTYQVDRSFPGVPSGPLSGSVDAARSAASSQQPNPFGP